VPDLHLQMVSLRKIDWVPGTEESPRPAEVFLSAGEEVGEMFEDGELGRLPSAAELRSWLPHARSILNPASSSSGGCAHMCAFGGLGCRMRCSQDADHGGPHGCEPCNSAAIRQNPSFRGGGGAGSGRKLRGQPVLPLRAGAGGAPIGGARGLELLRANLGDGDDEDAEDVDAIDALGSARGEVLSAEPTQGLVWVVADPLIGIPVGTAVRLPPGAAVLRNFALVELAGSVDPVLVQRMPASMVAAFRVEIDEKLLRAAGAITPRVRGSEPAAKGRAKEAVEEEATPSLGAHRVIQVPYQVDARVSQFMQLTRLTYGDPSMTEYAVIAKTIEFAIYADQLMVCNLIAFELLVRRFQLIEERYKMKLPQMDGRGGAHDPEQDTSLFLGLGSQAMMGRLALCVMPGLSEFIATELTKEASLNKGKIKAHELRQQLKRLNDPKGKAGARGAHDE
jgi:hypothetical protein